MKFEGELDVDYPKHFDKWKEEEKLKWLKMQLRGSNAVDRIQFSEEDTDKIFKRAAKNKLTDEEADEIRWIYDNFERVAKTRVAEHYGIPKTTIDSVVYNSAKTSTQKPEWIEEEEVGIGKSLSDEQVKEVRWLWRHTELTQYDIGDLYDIAASHVSRLVNRKQRSDVEGVKQPDFATVTQSASSL